MAQCIKCGAVYQEVSPCLVGDGIETHEPSSEIILPHHVWAHKSRPYDYDALHKVLKRVSNVFVVMRVSNKYRRSGFVQVTKRAVRDLMIDFDTIYGVIDGRSLFIGFSPNEKWDNMLDVIVV